MSRPLGVVLAGGAGSRLGGVKATVPVAGRPMISWPVEVLGGALGEVVVVAKADTVLPELDVPVWVEPDEPRHPLAGVVHALGRAEGRAVVVCAVDLVLVTAELVRLVAGAEDGPVVVVRAGGRLQPLLGRYEPTVAGALTASAKKGEAAGAAVLSLDPVVIDRGHDPLLLNVNTREDVRTAERHLARRAKGRAP